MRDEGVSLVELLIALGLSIAVAGAAFALILLAADASSAIPEAADLQQRARVAADAIWRDLAMAGAGIDGGALGGSLGGHFAVVFPRRLGLQSPDAATVASRQVITVLYMPMTPAQATTSGPIGPASLQLQLNLAPACPASPALCGLAQGVGVLVMDAVATDRFDLFTLASVSGSSGTLTHRAPASPNAFDAGAAASEVEMHTYYFDALNRQLRHYDGATTDVPVVDHVVGLSFDYFGDPQPPASPRPPLGVENCLYDAAGAAKPLSALTPAGGSLAPLPLSSLTDGPWCGAGATVFDADLLRVRRIRVTLRLEAALDAVRGTGPAFVNPGTSRNAGRAIPDLVVTFDVSPRNLSGHR